MLARINLVGVTLAASLLAVSCGKDVGGNDKGVAPVDVVRAAPSDVAKDLADVALKPVDTVEVVEVIDVPLPPRPSTRCPSGWRRILPSMWAPM